ncbi:hypothetical protein DL546_001795 [Coniochaeta pulveracea]|uniref:Uncharacterized protein n=1 Tax=Coniochaeta pulveracea TaxID=177199 RepID=A0A420Y1S6_9PEZI|nr:hypothetical protein DL546_001795 [Coniochaeta pulveracea]
MARNLSDEDLRATTDSQRCTGTAIPTIFGWEGEGVWVLQLEEGDAWMNTHIENLKAFGAVWYANAIEHPVAKEVLARSS